MEIKSSLVRTVVGSLLIDARTEGMRNLSESRMSGIAQSSVITFNGTDWKEKLTVCVVCNNVCIVCNNVCIVCNNVCIL